MKPSAFPYIFLVAITALLYAQTISYDFVYDDIPQVQDNQLVQQATGVLNIPMAKIFSSPTFPGNLYRPFTTLSYAIVHAVAGQAPAPQHLVNVLLHIGVVCILYLILLGVVGLQFPAFVGALIFAVHPLNTEAVANVVGRAELLAAFLALSSFIFFERASRDVHAIKLYAVGTFCLLLALLSKESAIVYLVSIPLVLFMLRNSIKPRVFAALGIVVALGVCARILVLGSNFIIHSDGTIYPENPLFHLRFADRLIPALVVLGEYIRAFFLPFSLSADYSMMPEALFARVYSMDGVFSLISVGLLAALVFGPKRFRLGPVWFFVAFAVTSNIFTPIGTIRADRLAYTPNIGLVILVASILTPIGTRWLRVVLSAIPVSIFTLTSLSRIPVWKNKGELFARTALESPESPKAMYNYGLYLFKDQKDSSHAEGYLREALLLNPKHLDAAKCLADIALERKEYGRLEYWYRRILEISPNDAIVTQQLLELKKIN